MSESRKATQAEIAHAFDTMFEFSHEVARRNGLVDGTSERLSELMLIVRDLGRAATCVKHQNKEKFRAHIYNAFMRLCTLSHMTGVPASGVVDRAIQNSKRKQG